ncbi:MAG: hypothetical protein HO274_02390 [Ferrovum myxofaciens]|nr:hypothetical protein [Ferrovum myxofaciens]QKE40306.1 MAG: hypothetical protein HO274_02390 [Ferrovum myxofaciens]
MANGHVRARDLEGSPLLIPHRTLMNWTKQYRQDGPCSFYRTIGRAAPRVITPDKIAECARILAEGIHPSEVARRAGINESTLRKALKRNAIPQLPCVLDEGLTKPVVVSKSERSRVDAEAASAMGTACTRADERVAAAMGLAGSASARFEVGHDVQMAGGAFDGLACTVRERLTQRDRSSSQVAERVLLSNSTQGFPLYDRISML